MALCCIANIRKSHDDDFFLCNRWLLCKRTTDFHQWGIEMKRLEGSGVHRRSIVVIITSSDTDWH